ncbi:MAG: methyltransferase [Sciscionella sp.]|nr:methyltransferase [Sciscionella sp.]
MTVAGIDVELRTDTGVFAKDRLDPGTEILLRRMTFPADDGDVLDLGCGYGPIAIALASRCPNARVWAVDVNERALELVRDNAKNLGIENVIAVSPDAVDPRIRFTAIYSNPPIRIGKEALHELVTHWLSKLTEDGRAQFVVQRNLGADSLAQWMIENEYHVTRIASQRGYRVLEISRASTS